MPLAALLALSSVACVERLPPAPTPRPVAPALEAGPPPREGQARLVVDVVEGPTPVRRVSMDAEPTRDAQGRTRFRLFESSEVLCPETPCVADLRPGNVLLGFPVLGNPGAMEVELVHVGPEPSVYRRSLSIYKRRRGTVSLLGIIGTAVGGSAVAAGAALLPVGLAKDNRGLATAGAISLGAGAALLTIGILAIRHDPSIFRAGSSIHFPLSGQGGAPGDH